MRYWYEKTPLVCLAPMENYSDSAFRQVVRDISKEIVVFTEFISIDGLYYNSKEVLKKGLFKKREKPIVIQLFGNNIEFFRNAYELLKDFDIDGIDINMGCPASKVIQCQYGAALLQSPEKAWRIAEEIVKISRIPISIKTRLGWEDPYQIIDFAKGFENIGVQVITVHGRTYKQGFLGDADWEPIYELKRNTKMKVIGNGDIRSAKDILRIKNNLDGVMIGRGAFGNPWVLKEVYDSLNLDKEINLSVSFKEKIPFMIKHIKYLIDLKGERKAMFEIRKHLSSYVKGIDGASKIRSRLVRVESFNGAKEILEDLSK